MKVSAYIEALEKIKEDHGDLQLAVHIIREYDGEESLDYVGLPEAEEFENEMVAIVETRLK